MVPLPPALQPTQDCHPIFPDTYTLFLLTCSRIVNYVAKNDFRGTKVAASGNPIVIYVPNRANRRVHGIGIQHRPGMRNRNLFSFPFPIPFPACSTTQIFHYFPIESQCTWFLFISLYLSSFITSLLF